MHSGSKGLAPESLIIHHTVKLSRSPAAEAKFRRSFLKVEDVVNFDVGEKAIIIRMVSWTVTMRVELGRRLLSAKVERTRSMETVTSELPPSEVSG